MQTDRIDTLIGQWRRERPDVDPSAMGIAGRVLRLAQHLERRLEVLLAEYNLMPWQFDVLATLRRSGPPYQMTPTRLMQSVMLSSGAMTNRLDRLEAAGLVKRQPDPADRRGVLITLTAKGRRMVDDALPARFHEARLNRAVLSDAEARGMEASLRKLLLALDPESTDAH